MRTIAFHSLTPPTTNGFLVFLHELCFWVWAIPSSSLLLLSSLITLLVIVIFSLNQVPYCVWLEYFFLGPTLTSVSQITIGICTKPWLSAMSVSIYQYWTNQALCSPSCLNNQARQPMPKPYYTIHKAWVYIFSHERTYLSHDTGMSHWIRKNSKKLHHVFAFPN